ncbi:MAG: hypothetical protein ABSB35_41300 [Bryobacteraceae bacterium]|jgi:hypothetical protein
MIALADFGFDRKDSVVVDGEVLVIFERNLLVKRHRPNPVPEPEREPKPEPKLEPRPEPKVDLRFTMTVDEYRAMLDKRAALLAEIERLKAVKALKCAK